MHKPELLFVDCCEEARRLVEKFAPKLLDGLDVKIYVTSTRETAVKLLRELGLENLARRLEAKSKYYGDHAQVAYAVYPGYTVSVLFIPPGHATKTTILHELGHIYLQSGLGIGVKFLPNFYLRHNNQYVNVSEKSDVATIREALEYMKMRLNIDTVIEDILIDIWLYETGYIEKTLLREEVRLSRTAVKICERRVAVWEKSLCRSASRYIMYITDLMLSEGLRLDYLVLRSLLRGRAPAHVKPILRCIEELRKTGFTEPEKLSTFITTCFNVLMLMAGPKLLRRGIGVSYSCWWEPPSQESSSSKYRKVHLSIDFYLPDEVILV